MIGPDPWDEGRGPRGSELVRLPWIIRAQRWSRSQLAEHHARQLGRVLHHARTRSAFWSDRIPPDLGPDGVTASDLRRLAIIDKQTLLDVPHAVRSSRPPTGPRHRSSTSGSTGEPFELEIAASTTRWTLAHFRAAHLANGLFPFSSLVVLRSTKAPTRTRWDASRPPAELADEIARRRPKIIFGLPHVLVEVGEQLAGRHRPKALVVGGETTDASSAQQLSRLYGVDPLDTYNSIEFGAIAWQCNQRDLYHLHHTLVHVEVLDCEQRAVEPGATGDVVITGLAHPATPLIRYRIGDRATLADRPCRCGSTLPALAAIDGRIHDWFATPGGRLAPQRLYLSRHMPPTERIRRYRITQDESGLVELEYQVAGEPPAPAAVDAMAASYRTILDGAPFVARQVDDLRLQSSGKFGQFRSELRNGWPPEA